MAVGLVLLTLPGCGGGCDIPDDPNVTQMVPTSAPRSSPPVSLKVTGSNFRSDSFISLDNAVRLDTTFVSATELDATIPATSLQTAGTLQVRAATAYTCGFGLGAVCNPCFKTSSVFAFTVTP